MEKIIIYVAGNPSAYPMEYYDPETESYQGMIPQLLRQFSDESVYDVRYYSPSEKDQRERQSADLQVDIISGCDGTETLAHLAGEPLILLETAKDGQPVTYQLCLTKTAPDSLEGDLRGFLPGVSYQTKTGLLLDAVERQRTVHSSKMQLAAVGLALAVLALTIAILLLIRKHRLQLKQLSRSNEIDEITGIGNTEHLARYCLSLINDKNRILYSMFYFYFDIQRMERTGSRQDAIEFLRYTAMILQDYTADTDILARVSDSGFALLRLCAGEREQREWFLPALERIRDFSRSYGKTCACGIAAGIYPLRADDRDLNEIIFNAAQSAQAAYQEGVDYKLCTDEVIRTIMEEKRLQADIDQGFENEEFQLYIQFYVDARTGLIVGGEALSRWEHPDRGLLTPGRFVPLMEKEGLIGQLDYYVLEKVCAFLDELCSIKIENFFVSCNFSRETLSSNDFVPRCREILERHRFPRELLIAEITENSDTNNLTAIKQNIRRLQQLGISIVLDDFGTGFTSFSDIQEYPLNGLKLDKSLIDNLGTDPGNIILRAMIQIGHELGITVLAEGVENNEQLRILCEMDCDIIQGFCFYHPIPVWEARRQLTEQAKSKETVQV